MPRPWRCRGEPSNLVEAGRAGESPALERGALRGEQGSALCPHVAYGYPALPCLLLLPCSGTSGAPHPSCKWPPSGFTLLTYIFMHAQSSSPPSSHPLCRDQDLASPVTGLVRAQPCCGMQGLASPSWQPEPIHLHGVTPAPASSVLSQGQESSCRAVGGRVTQ